MRSREIVAILGTGTSNQVFLLTSPLWTRQNGVARPLLPFGSDGRESAVSFVRDRNADRTR
jgi:hypothetical protein